MHRQLLNELEIAFALEPDGPIMVKASDSTDPARPDMEFVRTNHQGSSTIYLPGSSLKGAFRAHCEKIARSVQPAPQGQRPGRLACNPLAKASNESCGQYLQTLGEQRRRNRRNSGVQTESDENNSDTLSTKEIYRESCFVCRLFGNTSLSSHLRIADALPTSTGENDPTNPNNHTEQRNGVAIDRLFGSVAVGPFQFEVATAGQFQTSIYLRNFTLAQLGLLGLMLRDLEKQRLLIGFGKSRGLGRVKLHYQKVTVRYPMADEEGRLGSVTLAGNGIYGVGSLVPVPLQEQYKLPVATDDRAVGPFSAGPGQAPLSSLGLAEYDLLDGATVTITSEPEILALWRAGVEAWRKAVAAAGGQQS